MAPPSASDPWAKAQRELLDNPSILLAMHALELRESAYMAEAA